MNRMKREDKEMFLALVDDKPDVVTTILELNNQTNLYLSLDGIEIPPLLHDSPPLISIAIYLEAQKCISALLIHSSNVNITDAKGRKPIHFAAACNQIPTLKILENYK